MNESFAHYILLYMNRSTNAVQGIRCHLQSPDTQTLNCKLKKKEIVAK